MPRKKLNVKTSWAQQYANEASNIQYLDDINAMDRDLLSEIQSSIDRTNQLQKDMADMYAERRAMQEDPEGYLYEKGQQELEADEDKQDYWKNWRAKFGRDMNNFQIKDFQGYIDRAGQWEVLANDVKEYLDIEDKLTDITKELKLLRGALAPSPEAAQKMQERIAELDHLRQELASRHRQLEESVDAFKSYIPSGTMGAYYNLVAGDGNSFGFSNNAVFGRTSQAHDELGDILRHTTSMFSPNRSRAEKKVMLQNALDEKQKKVEEWQKAIDLNIQDRESYAKVDRWFENRANKDGFDIFDSNTWLYKMPGLLAGTASGASKIIPSMLTGIATAAAIGSTSGLAAVPVIAAGGATTFQLNYGAGVGENNAEVAFAYNEKIEDYLKSQKTDDGTLYDDIVKEGRKKLNLGKDVTDEQVFELYRAGRYGINNAEANRKMLDLGIGIQNQFQDDMAATTWMSGVESLLQIVPIGRLTSVPKAVKFQALKTASRRAAVRSFENSKVGSAITNTVSAILNSKVAKILSQGFEIGSAAGPLGAAVYAPVHAMVSPALKWVGKKGKRIVDEISKTSWVAERIPKSTLSKKFMTETRKKYMKDLAGRWILSSAGEGIEEAKQRISQDRYANGEYDSRKIKSIGETLLDDFLAGSKSAGLLLGMPFESLMSEKDRELLQEIKGGLIVGGLQTAMVNTATSIAPYRKEISANKAIINTVLSDKAGKIDALNKAKIYAEAAKSASSYQNMLDGFKRLKEINQNEYESTGEYNIPQEQIDAELVAFKRVAQMANDPYTIKQAEAQDIKPTSKEYQEFVSMKSLADQELKDAKDVVILANQNFQDVQQQISEAILTQRMKESGMIDDEDTNKDGRVIEHTSAEDYNRLQNVAKYSALLRRKEQIEAGILNAKGGNHKAIETILELQLTEINDHINNLKPSIQSYVQEGQTVDIDNLESVEKNLVLSKQDHEDLTEAYRSVIVADQDYDLAFNNYERVVGKAQLNGKDIERGQEVNYQEEFDNVSFVGGEAKKVYQEIQDTLKDDDNLASAIDEDFEKAEQEAAQLEAAQQAPEAPVEQQPTVEQQGPVEAPELPIEQGTKQPDQQLPLGQVGDKTQQKTAAEAFIEDVEKEQKKLYIKPEISITDKPETVQQRAELTETKEVAEKPETTEQPVVVEERTTKKVAITPAQLDTLNSLKKKAEESSKCVKEVTPEYYIIEVNGEDIQMPRTHSVMPKYWAQDGSFMPPLQVGNIMDNLCRICFGDAQFVERYETNKGALISELLEEKASHKDNPNDPSVSKIAPLKYKDVFVNREAFENAIYDLYLLKKQYDRLGWVLVTDPIVWYNKFATGWIAGETDMLAVDKEGNIIIIDFKTAAYKKGNIKDPFSRYTNVYRPSLNQELSDRLLELNESDFKQGPRGKGLSKQARNLIKDIRKFLKNDKVVLVWNDDTKQASFEYINSAYYNKTASSFRQTHFFDGELKGSKADEYSDQLTAYMRMILANVFNVVDMEVIGLRVDYTHDGTNMQKISDVSNSTNGIPFRIKVFSSDEMDYILNHEGDPVVVETNQPDTVVDSTEKNNVDVETKQAEQLVTTSLLPTNPEPEVVVPGTTVDPNSIEINGYSNLNPVVIDREYKDLATILALDPNFVDSAIANGSIELYTEVIKDRKGEIPSLYADITYNGKTYKHIYVYADASLMAKVQTLEKIKKDGQKIVASAISRTSGTIIPGKMVRVVDSALLDKDVNSILFNSADGHFGVVKNGKLQTFVGNNSNMMDVIYEFPKATLPEGSMVYLKTIRRSKAEGGDQVVPVVLNRSTLSKDVDFIMNCLMSIDSMNTPFIINKDGRDVSLGVTNRELLNLLIPYIDDISQVLRTHSIIRHPNEPSLFYIVDRNKHAVAQVDIRNQQSIDQFKQALGSLFIEELHDMMRDRLGQLAQGSVFQKIYKFFANDKNGIKSIEVSPTLKFDFNDFANGGISGLSWYMKRGVFITNYDGMGSPKVSINDVSFMDKQPIVQEVLKEDQPIESTFDPAEGFTVDEIDNIANWGDTSLYKRKTEKDEDKPLLTKETIKKHLRPILGDLVDDPNVVMIITTLAKDPNVNDAAVVGKASADAITLYNGAFEGVDYHEAFHRIFELFVPEEVRESIYKKTAKQLKIDLSKSTVENDFRGHRDVAEYLADKYMEHRRFNVSTGIYWLDKAINYVVDIVSALCHFSNRLLYKVFLDINSGKYRNKSVASKKNHTRFRKMFGELNYEIHGQQFNNIANDPMYEVCKESAFFVLLQGQQINVSGSNIQDAQISREAFMRGAEAMKRRGFDVFGTEVEPEKRTAAQLAMVELYTRFDAIQDDLAAMLSSISTDYRKVMQDDGREEADGGESQSSYDENFFKWSYEFSRFDKTSSRVKFFFSTIPAVEYTDDSNKTYKYVLNEIGLPQFQPMNYVFNEVLINLWDVDTVDEVITRLTKLAMHDPTYNIILNRFKNVVKGRVNKDGSTNADNEALLAQLMGTIRSNRHTFMLLRSEQNRDKKYDIIVQRTDADYNARTFPIQWSQVLTKGGTETLKVDKYGSIVFNPKNKDSVYTFKKIAKLFTQLQNALSSVNNGVGEINVPIYEYPEYEYEDSLGNVTKTRAYIKEDVLTDLNDPKQLEKAKNIIVEALNRIGINIHKEELDYMLRHKYQTDDYTALKMMMQSTDKTDSIGSFIFFLDNIVKDGQLNLTGEGKFVNASGKQISFDNIYSDIAFVKELSGWKYEYRHAHDQLSVLATGGNRFYEMSDNDYMSDVVRNCNKRGKWFDDLRKDCYNYFVGDVDAFGNRHIYGSLVLKTLSEDRDTNLQLKHFVGFKTDKKGDEGQDYFQISRREDYLSKAGILENGGIISLTLSDKKKYVYLSGVKLPGIDYSNILSTSDTYINKQLAEQILLVPDEVSSVYSIQQREDVVDQMISYATSEYESILRNGVRLNDGHRKVANFDTKLQSVRFSSLLGVWEETFDKNGNPSGEQFISFNDNKKSWEENLAIAEAYFFDRPIEEQRSLMARVLTKRAEQELNTAAELGIVEKVGDSKNLYLNYRNVGLNDRVIKSIKQSYKLAYPKLTDELAESLAVVMYLNDISAKAIMSGQEMERLFSGNPAFYKWKYDKSGNLIDRTVDELKRLGGLGSTGNNNFLELSNLPERYKEGRYVAAEVDNEMVASPQYEEVTKSVYEGALRQEVIDDVLQVRISEQNLYHNNAIVSIRRNKYISDSEKNTLIKQEDERYEIALQLINKEVCSEIDSKSVEDLEKEYSELAKSVKQSSKEISDAISGDIDVADGGAYITDEMCEMLLRMEGAYSKDIQEAFKILRGEMKANYLSQIEAYNKVRTSVIGNQKYTAFGRRLQNGVSVPYYHKMALFPIFDCIATGRMGNIFAKMKEQGIDMLLVNSAVKVGSEGSKSINWDDFRQDDDKFNEHNYVNNYVGQKMKPSFKEGFNFETYDCEFDYLRKQLNTDPKEEEILRMGTQMQKIVFSNLLPGRTYVDYSGEQIDGKQLLDRIMQSSNALSDLGVDKINKRFFVTNEDGQLLNSRGEVIDDRNSNERLLDIEKFSKEVSKLMSDRGADKNIMKALELVTAANKSKLLSIPLGAISGSEWLESVLISMLNKDIIDVNTPGAFFIQRSVWGMQGMRMYDGKTNIQGRTLYGGKRLQMINENGSMDCVLSIDFFEHILPQVPSGEYELDEEGNYIYKKDKDGNYLKDKYGNYIPKQKMRDMTFDEARDWLLKKGIIGGLANIVAYRIPTLAESSIHALRCVDVLPVVRDTVILPEEFTKLTGSDFKRIEVIKFL